MDATLSALLLETASRFTLPRYDDIPDVGLFLDQVARYAAKYTDAVSLPPLTGSMISNYVKKKVISNPVKKLYGRDQIAYLLFIAFAKGVLQMEDLACLIARQQELSTVKEAYEAFREQMSYCIHAAMGADSLEIPQAPAFDPRGILKAISTASAQGIYLELCLKAMRSPKPDGDNA